MKKSTLARFAFLLLLVAMLASLCSCTMIPDEDNRVSFEIEGYGRVVVQLDPKAAPLTVANFKKLVNEGFYNGLTFHRIADLTGEGGFIVQGGDPNGNGSGGSKETVKGEFSANGVDNPLKHTRGTISMARSNDMNSASSQFFFCTDTTEHLDGNYAAFGKVVYGMRVIDKMSEVMTDSNSKPYYTIKMTWVKMGTHNTFKNFVPGIFGGLGVCLVLIFVYVTFQSALITPNMEAAMKVAFKGDKRKRKALEKEASGLASYFYLHAKDVLPKRLVVTHLSIQIAWALFAVAAYAMCLSFNLYTLLAGAVTLVGLIVTNVLLCRFAPKA